ncbi:UvrD-helicase domain-containing protein [Galbitalea sp. SE-J8]|uniref:HelD family protein n=1 Tax=Galbitalea sp. SE-J8 TaxID=3054952 RepID=UPI00259C799E|nr:UvrD-helicase domain-containing protein [Galbitalea sp. SE-J8]MDM4762599.1 UvrD-helicase domain-containing protein [Galbitalea sp. SE-J8]
MARTNGATAAEAPGERPVDSELALEQRYVDGLYARLDVLREEAAGELRRVQAQGGGGTHQNRTERDAFARLYEDRIAQLNAVGERVAFGRIELAPETPGGATAPAGSPTPPVRHYIGRIGLRDERQQPLLLDWRVPQARPFYQATAAQPLGVRARRHLQGKGRRISRIDDEIFDADLLDSERDTLQGEAALFASLTERRTGRMGDIVATIQAEQDRIIRSELHGALVVQGGPGTGKTAVALHRAAYLLYTHRERLERSGVLIVGPSRSFLTYIESVLPSLGETGVVLSSVGGLFPGVEATTDDAPATAALKGSTEMADLLRRAVRSRQVVPDAAQVVEIEGERLAIEPHVIRSAMQRAWDTRAPHNLARSTFNRAALSAITRLLADQLRSHGTTIEDSDLGYLREDVRQAYDVRVVLNTAWLPLTPQKLLDDLYARPNWLASLTPRWSDEKRALLRRERGSRPTISDVPLLDEAAELLGEADATSDAQQREREAQRRRDVENAEAAIRNMGVEGLVDAERLASGFEESAARLSTAERAAADRTWAYGHVVVDEAQELSPMQWRVLTRRVPSRSFTIVGDIAQASAATAAPNWATALRGVTDDWRIEELTVNYRTPARIARSAEAMAEAHGVTVTRSTSVREGEWPIAVEIGPDLTSGAVRAVAADRAISTEGTIGVIAPPSLVGELVAALQARFPGAVGRDAAGLDRDIAVLSPTEAKGLEFDTSVVVDPVALVDSAPRGAASLYVAMTRATQRLHLVTATEPLPAGILLD